MCAAKRSMFYSRFTSVQPENCQGIQNSQSLPKTPGNVDGANSSGTFLPLTQPSVDQYGRQIQLWSHGKYGMVGSISTPSGSLKYIVAGNHIHNGLNPTETGPILKNRLAGSSTMTWDLAYIEETRHIHVWPKLEAAAKRDEHVKYVFGKRNMFNGRSL